MIYWISYYILKVVSKIFFPFTAIGRENIPSQGGYIFASNHLSYLDPVLIGLNVNCRISYMGKDSLFRNKALGHFLSTVGTFPVRRGKPDVRALREAIRRLKQGCPLVVFPEGTRTKAEKKKKPPGVLSPPASKDKATGLNQAKQKSVHSGIGFLAAKSGVPVVPVYITGSDKVLPQGARWLKRYPITIVFGKPIWFLSDDSYPQMACRIMESIASLSLTR